MKILKKILLYTLCLAMLLPLATSFVSAAPIADEDFEDMATSDLQAPDWVGANTGNAVNGGVIEKAPDAIKYISKPTKTKALGSIGTTNKLDQGIITLTNDLPDATGEISFDLYVENACYKGLYLEFKGLKSGEVASAFKLVFFKPSAEPNGKYSSYGEAILAAYSGKGGDAIEPSYHGAYTPVLKESMKNGEYMQTGEWHSIKIKMTKGTGTAALYIDNYKVADVTVDSEISCISSLNIQRMSWDAGAQAAYIDNLKFTDASTGTPYFFEDFEDYNLGAAPTSVWQHVLDKSQALTVAELDAPKKVIEYTKALGSVRDTGIDSGVLSLTENLPAATKEVSFDVYAENCSNKGFYISFRNKTGGTITQAFALDFQLPSVTAGGTYASYGSSVIVSYSGSGGTAPSFHSAYPAVAKSAMPNGEYLRLGEWHNIRIVMTEGASTAALYIDNHKTADITADPSISLINNIWIQKNSGDDDGANYVFVDNLKLIGTDSAEPYYQNDFETYQTGLVNSSIWALNKSTDHRLTVAEVPVANNAIVFSRPTSSSVNTSVEVKKNLPAFTSEVSFSAKIESGSTKGWAFDIMGSGSLKVRLNFADPSLVSDKPEYVGKQIVHYYDPTNKVAIEPAYFSQGTTRDPRIIPVKVLDPSTWYTFTLKFTEGSDRVSLYINGRLVSETVYDNAPTIKVIDKILIQNITGNTGEFAYVDDIRLYGDYSSTPYYQNDFEGETIGVATSSMTNNDNMRVMYVAGTTPIPEFVATESVEGSNAYKVYQNGSGQTLTYRSFVSTNTLTVSFDYLATEISSTSGSYISLSSGISGKGTWMNSVRVHKLSSSDTKPALTDGAGNHLGTLELGVWYNMKFEYANGVAKFYLNGEYLGDIPSANASVTSVDGIFFGTTSGSSSKDTYYIDNLKFIGAEGFEMNDTPIEFTDSFDSEPAGYTFSGSGSHTVSGGNLILSGAMAAKRTVAHTRSGKFGFSFEADKLEGINVTLYQDDVAAVVIKFEEDGTILCKRNDKWIEISDPGKLAAGKKYDFSLDLAPNRNSNYFNVRVDGEITATALYLNQFSYITAFEVSVPAGTTAKIDTLYTVESDGIIEMPEREESSPEIYLPVVINGARPMYLTNDNSPLTSSLNYVTGSEELVLDSYRTSIGIDLGSVQPVNALRITCTDEINRSEKFNAYTVYQSDDNQNWIKVKGFSFNHYTENGVSVALFEVSGVEARYLKVTSIGSSGKFTVADPLSIRAEVRIARQWKMAGNAMYALDDTDPVYTPMTRELYDRAITVNKGDSVGINFGINTHVEAIELVGDGLAELDENAFKLYMSSDNAKYTLIENVTLSRSTRDGKEVYRLTFADTVCGYLKLYADVDMNVELADLYDGLCAYSSVEVDSGNIYYWTPNRGGEGDFYTMPDGTLVMVYTGYPLDGEATDYADNTLKATSSIDGGYTWSNPWITLFRQDENVNLMCASYHYMANGDLAIVYIEKLQGDDAHVLIRRSSDYGRSWGEPICITEEPFGYSILSSAVNGLHLSNGRFVIAVNYNFASSDAHGSDRAVSYMAYSDDDGYTWKKSSTFVTLPNSSVEPVIAELENGDLIMTMRTRKENSIYQTISTDNGETWAQPERVENINTPSSTNSVHTLPATGDLLMVWNDEVYDPNSNNSGNGKRDPLCYAISTDHGLTYKNQRNIIEASASWACLRFYGRAVVMCYSAGTSIKVTDIAELYYTREGNKTVADLPTAATPAATYENGWLNGVSDTMMYSLDGGESWSFCGGSSVKIGEVTGDILVKDIGTHEYAPSGVQTIGTTTVLASDLSIVPGEVSEVALNSLLTMAGEGGYTFVFDSGVYVFPKTIALPSNTTVMGGVNTVFMLNKGASGKAASPAVISIGSGVDNVRITNLTVKGYNSTVFCPTYSANNIGISISKSLRVNIDHVNVVGFADSGIKATNLGCEFYNDNLTYDQRQAYFKGLQLSDCRIEKCYYGLHLGSRAEYCQITNLAAGYNNVGCVNSGGNNSFVNCLFDKNNTGYYLLCTNMSNPGHGGATGCSFNHNKTNALVVEGNQIGFTFTGCQFFDGKIKQSNSCGTIFSACILGSVKLEASGSAGSGIFTACFFQTDRDTILAGNNGVFTVTDCIDVPAEAMTVSLSSEQTEEPQMMMLSARNATETPKAYNGSTTLMASDFGVVPGDVSAAALNALIAKANEGGYTFVFDSGIYVFPKTIVVPSNTALVGDAGTVFMLNKTASGKADTPAVISIGHLVDNVRISNLTVKGHNSTDSYPAYAYNTVGIKVHSALKVNIDRVTVTGFAEAGIKATSMGMNFWDNSKTDDEKQAYFKSLQLSDCRLENNYIGLNLGRHAEYCQMTNVVAGFNNIGCVNSGGNNTFVNCSFNNNNVGFSLDCTDMPNPGHGGASGCSFIKNNSKAISIKDNKIGFTFNACNVQGEISSINSVGIIFNACLIDSALEASGSTGSGIFYGCRIKNDSSLISGNNGVFSVVDCLTSDSAIATPDTNKYQITENAPTTGKTINVSALGVVPGVVSNEALDALTAFAANGGYTLKFESGVYEFGKSFEIPSNTTVTGCANTVLKLTGSSIGTVPVIKVVGVDNVKLQSLTVLGEQTQNYVESTKAGYGEGSVGIYINNALRVALNNVTVKNFKDSAVKIENVGLNGYCETVQIADCRFENSYYGLHLANGANFCQIVRTVMGYCASGCIDYGANNSFANCFFNCNRCGFYVLNTNPETAGAGTVVNSSFTHNTNYSMRIDKCVNGYTFSGCIYQGTMRQSDSTGIIISSSVLCSVNTSLSGTAGSCLMIGCFFQTNKATTLSGNKNVYKVIDCIEVPAAE